MDEGTIRQFQEVIKRLHGCEAEYVESVPVHEEFEGQTVWDGIVHVFDLEGHPSASRCYTWAEPGDRRGRRQRFIAVLHQEPVASPLAAVQAHIVEDYRQHGGQRG